jgi:two-component sensor histidine kinase
MLTAKSWDSAEIHDVMWLALRPHATPGRDRFVVEGPDLRLSPQSSVTFSMAVHELCTNAIKYGALSADGGRVAIAWTMDGGRFRWRWQESGGPPVREPASKGFGSRMIERALALQFSGTVTVEYDPAGVVCTIDAPLPSVHDAGDHDA